MFHSANAHRHYKIANSGDAFLSSNENISQIGTLFSGIQICKILNMNMFRYISGFDKHTYIRKRQSFIIPIAQRLLKVPRGCGNNYETNRYAQKY